MKETINNVNQKIISLWEEMEPSLLEFDTNLKVPYVHPSDLKKTDLLFIGFNPSFVPSEYKRILQKNPHYQNVNPEEFYRWKGSKDCFNKLDDMINIEKVMRTEYKLFFGEIEKFAKEINMAGNWEHIDLFCYRTTNQNQFKQHIFNQKAKRLTPFGSQQIELAKQLIYNFSPKIMIVANALASDILINEYALQNQMNQDGYYPLKTNCGTTAVFFSSMLSGGHTDKYSRERLALLVKKAKDSIRI